MQDLYVVEPRNGEGSKQTGGVSELQPGQGGSRISAGAGYRLSYSILRRSTGGGLGRLIGGVPGRGAISALVEC